MYDTMKNKFYWPHMANDAYTKVHQCQLSAHFGKRTKPKRKLQLFILSGPLKFIVIDILRPFPSAEKGDQHVLLMKDRYEKDDKRDTECKE